MSISLANAIPITDTLAPLWLNAAHNKLRKHSAAPSSKLTRRKHGRNGWHALPLPGASIIPACSNTAMTPENTETMCMKVRIWLKKP